MPKLPPEILLHVISLLDPKSLDTVMGVSRFFADEAERFLYRSISMCSTDGRHERIRAALAKKPQRATYVKTLEITMDTPETFTSELVLTLVSLTQCTFPYLTHFRSTWSLNDLSFRTFLKAHSSLKSLELGKSFSTFTLPTSFPLSLIPKLEVLDGHWSNVVRLVKGRPVTRVAIRSANMASYVPYHRLERILPIIASGSDSAYGVQRLAVHVKEIIAAVVRLIAHELPALAALELVDCSYSDEEGYDIASLLAKMDGIGEAMRGFKALREFHISGVMIPGRSESVSGVIAENLGKSVSELERVMVNTDAWVRRDDVWVQY